MILNMKRGDTPTFTLSVLNYSGSAMDLTTVEEIWFTAKRGFNDADEDAVFQKTIGDGITVTTPLEGLVTIVLEPSDTSTVVDKEKLRYDVQVMDAIGGTYTVASGLLVVEPDVTRAIV